MVPTTNNEFLLFILVGIVLPFLVDLVTKKVAEPRVKSLTLLVLSLVAAGATTFFADPGSFDWTGFAYGFAFTFGTAVVTLFGVGKPLNLSGKDGVIANAVPGGLGRAGVQVITTETVSTSNLNAVPNGGTVDGVPVVKPSE